VAEVLEETTLTVGVVRVEQVALVEAVEELLGYKGMMHLRLRDGVTGGQTLVVVEKVVHRTAAVLAAAVLAVALVL
jgi:hypothetical protein|tara:strand:+ start:320 stop:547 length:228 start_codon:yes stop_codon:yes gene_type:complete